MAACVAVCLSICLIDCLLLLLPILSLSLCAPSLTLSLSFSLTLSYTATIEDSHPLLGLVVNVTATDQDPNDVITYAILNEQARGLSTGPSNYFFIESSTGEILLRRSLLGTGIVISFSSSTCFLSCSSHSSSASFLEFYLSCLPYHTKYVQY